MSDQLFVKDRDVVVPGETLATGLSYIPGQYMYREGDNIIAAKVGLVSVEGKVLKIVPLASPFIPKVGDVVIGVVEDVMLMGWRFNIGGPNSAVLNVKDATNEFIGRGVDLTQYFGLGDMVFCKIVNVTSQNLIDVTMRGPGLRKLDGGRVMRINPAKIPRVIGKEGTMAKMIMDATKTDIVVGQNGVIWISGSPEGEVQASNAIRKVDENAHMSGLTQAIKRFLEGGE